MDSEKDIVLYDWLSFTSKTHTPEDLIAALGLSSCPWQEIKGAHGYRDRKYFSCISIHYNGREDMGVWVEMSGQGCRTFETLSRVGWDALFSFIDTNHLKITRLDVAFDDHSGILNIRDIVEDTQEGNFVSKSDYWERCCPPRAPPFRLEAHKARFWSVSMTRPGNGDAPRGPTGSAWRYSFGMTGPYSLPKFP